MKLIDFTRPVINLRELGDQIFTRTFYCGYRKTNHMIKNTVHNFPRMIDNNEKFLQKLHR